MKIHSTHYFDTFIEVAEDTKGTSGQYRQQKTGAEMEYELIAKKPISLILTTFLSSICG
jgi:hypothetical protein